VGRLAPSAISLPRQLGFTWLVLQWCGAGFGLYDHGTPAAGDGGSVLELGTVEKGTTGFQGLQLWIQVARYETAPPEGL
jgi:hypothetical protein